jgi:hypothetical protein
MITKIKTVKDTQRTFESHGKTFHVHQYEFENGEHGQANHASALPYKVGDEVEIEEKKNDPKYGKTFKVSKPNAFQKGGGYKKPQLKFVDAKRMASSNAVHAVVTINSTYSEERLKGDSLATFEKFTLGGISGDIDKFTEEDSLFTSRLSSLNNAAAMSGYKSYNNALEVLEEAKKLYSYIIRG